MDSEVGKCRCTCCISIDPMAPRPEEKFPSPRFLHIPKKFAP